MTLLYVINPLMLIRGFWDKAYVFFFLANLLIFVIYFARNKALLKYLRSLLRGRTDIAIFMLLAIIFLHIISCVISMQPLNNLLPCSIEDIYMAKSFLAGGSMPYESFATRPLGPSVLLALTGAVLPFDLIYLYSFLGILISSLTIIALFLAVKHVTKKNSFSLLAALLYAVLSDAVYFASSQVETSLFSAYLLVLLILLYLTDTKDAANAKLILFCTTLLLYTRIENLALLLPLGIYLTRNFSRLKEKVGVLNLIWAYLLFLPSTILLSFLRITPYEGGVPYSFGFSNLFVRLISYLPHLEQEFSIPLLVLLSLGVLYCVFSKKQAKQFLLVPLMIFLVYLLYSQYDTIIFKYFFTLVPMLIFFIGVGAYWLSTLIKSRIWELCMAILFLVLVMTVPHPLRFSRFSMPISITNIISPSYFNGSRVVLYGPDDTISVYHKYYNYTTLMRDANSNLSQYDYLIFKQGDAKLIDALQAFTNEMHYLEAQNNVSFELDKITDVEIIFRIARK